MNRYRAILFGSAFALTAAPAFALDRETAQQELAQAAASVQSAERDDSAHYAAADLDEAHAMLAAAQRAEDARAWTDVGIYAERAKLAGDLASAHARQHRAETATAEIERSVDTLRTQLSVSGGTP